jgi:hypothetical protein
MSFQIDLLIHAANVLYLFAFMVRDILWLRILAVVAVDLSHPIFLLSPRATDDTHLLESGVYGLEHLLDLSIALRRA